MRPVASLLLLFGLSGLLAACGNVDTTPPAPEGALPAPDADGDGIADADDRVPCAGIRLVIANVAVDGARVSLDGEPVVTPDAFPTADVIETFLNVAPGANSLEVESALTGAARLHLIVEPSDKSGRLLDETLTAASAPSEVAFGFTVEAACAGD